MPAIAKLRYLKIAPRKVRLVADLIRGKSIEEAQTILNFTLKKAAQPLLKLLKSAIANAKEKDNLYISKIVVDEGPKYKRWMPRARGQAFEIQKKSSHVTILLDEIFAKSKKKIKEAEKTEPKNDKTDEAIEKIQKMEKPKFRPITETSKPKIEKGIKKIFRRKAF